MPRRLLLPATACPTRTTATGWPSPARALAVVLTTLALVAAIRTPPYLLNAYTAGDPRSMLVHDVAVTPPFHGHLRSVAFPQTK